MKWYPHYKNGISTENDENKKTLSRLLYVLTDPLERTGRMIVESIPHDRGWTLIQGKTEWSISEVLYLRQGESWTIKFRINPLVIVQGVIPEIKHLDRLPYSGRFLIQSVGTGDFKEAVLKSVWWAYSSWKFISTYVFRPDIYSDYFFEDDSPNLYEDDEFSATWMYDRISHMSDDELEAFRMDVVRVIGHVPKDEFKKNIRDYIRLYLEKRKTISSNYSMYSVFSSKKTYRMWKFLKDTYHKSIHQVLYEEGLVEETWEEYQNRIKQEFEKKESDSGKTNTLKNVE